MKKILFAILTACSLSVQAQDMRSCFVNIPDSLSTLLTKVNREDFGDFLDSHMKAEVKNRFGKMSEMRALTADYLDLKVSSGSSVEMKLLPMNDSVNVICVVRTYQGPVADSSVSFFDTAWHELPTSRFLDLPSESQFYADSVLAAKPEEWQNIRAKADIYLYRAKLSADNTTLSFTYTTPDYMDKETAEQLKPFLKSTPLVYKWEDRRFRPL